MTDLVQELTDMVSKKSELQKKYFQKWKIEDSERDDLNVFLHFFVEEFHYGMDYIADAYLFMNAMVLEETQFFLRNNGYRYTTFDEVNKIVYANPDYMKRYMMGVSISDYIWITHIKMRRYFEENNNLFSGERYLEIGPGFGQYLVKAMLNCNFKEYFACDVSKTSVDGSNRFLRYRNLADKCTVLEKDFFQYTSDDKFDCIVMGEVLEHVEKPLEMLAKIHELLSEGGKAFITTVINAPTLDHIYLFRSIDEVLDIAKEAGFGIFDYMYAAEADVSLEKAMKRRQAVVIAMILER